jgi:hypothetical protein
LGLGLPAFTERSLRSADDRTNSRQQPLLPCAKHFPLHDFTC